MSSVVTPTFRRPAPSIADADWSKLAPSTKALFQMADWALFYHVQESPRGSNRGFEIDWMLGVAKTGRGQPWCAAACYAALWLHGLRLPVAYPASVWSWHEFAHRYGLVVPKPVRGGLFLIVSPKQTHMGFVAEDMGDGRFRTYEGNTNDDGSREGYELVERTRDANGTMVFIDLAKFDAHVQAVRK